MDSKLYKLSQSYFLFTHFSPLPPFNVISNKMSFDNNYTQLSSWSTLDTGERGEPNDFQLIYKKTRSKFNARALSTIIFARIVVRNFTNHTLNKLPPTLLLSSTLHLTTSVSPLVTTRAPCHHHPCPFLPPTLPAAISSPLFHLCCIYQCLFRNLYSSLPPVLPDVTDSP